MAAYSAWVTRKVLGKASQPAAVGDLAKRTCTEQLGSGLRGKRRGRNTAGKGEDGEGSRKLHFRCRVRDGMSTCQGTWGESVSELLCCVVFELGLC